MLLQLTEAAPDFLTGTALVDLAGARAGDFAPEALVGQRVGPYRVDALVGSGGMGDVYRVHHEALERVEALKIVTADGDGARVLAEARAASALTHPNVVTTFAVGEAEGWRYIAMEWVEGETLRARLTRGPIAPAVAAPLAVQIADALAAAHRAGVVHRDLKPEHVIVTPAGRIKVLDFGIAARTGDTTRVGGGTDAYMAPEQASGLQAGPAADQYAFGVLLREMLTGAHPWRDAATALPDRDADAIVVRCLAPAPQDRFATTDTLVAVCRRWEVQLAAGPVTGVVAALRPS